MTLQEYLKQVNGKESDIINYDGEEAHAAVQENGNALRYVHNQTPEICLAAVQENGNALQYVHKSIFNSDKCTCGLREKLQKILGQIN